MTLYYLSLKILVKDPDASIRDSTLAARQAPGYQTLPAASSWTCEHVRLAGCPQEYTNGLLYALTPKLPWLRVLRPH